MRSPSSSLDGRRALLRFLAASPLLAGLAGPRGWLDAHAQTSDLITAAKDGLDVFDFEAVARKNLSPAHFGYLETGTDDDGTIRVNREGFTRYELRVRRLIDISRIDPSVSVLGAKWDSPIFLCPVGSHRAFHADGELAVARGAKPGKHMVMLATPSTTAIEDVNAARGEPVWFQLYRRNDWNQTRQMIKRAEASGCPALVFTVDLLGGSNRLTSARAERRDTLPCASCHPKGLDANRRKPMIADLKPAAAAPEIGPPTWEFVKRLKDATPMKLVVKGIVTREDAEMAVEHGVDVAFVSNHGGRAENSLRSAVECVPEVVAGVAGRIPVIVDSGFRRGTDIFKALALGATAVGVGRPYIWGLAAFGQEGVEAVLVILRRELQMVMRQAGTTAVNRITKAYLVDRRGQ
ncbi:MAG TPA: alpha-hydroxy acid oxidase [Vicinamibacterales bacterium]|jgi:isopentenyl diphosphate isomerase/L-lactate dehydrogenase-like FMN-dependent dehydrogenase